MNTTPPLGPVSPILHFVTVHAPRAALETEAAVVVVDVVDVVEVVEVVVVVFAMVVDVVVVAAGAATVWT